jgi:exodeoxyribonuclease V alpha subunit
MNICAADVGSYLKALRRIGDLELRQARFFSSRLPDKTYRNDLHLLLLLLLACLNKGSARAKPEDLVDCVNISGEYSFINKEELKDLNFFGDNSLPGSVKKWLDGIDENFIINLTPLVSDGINSDDSNQPLVIYDKIRKAFSFQSYYISESFLAEVLPEMVRTGHTELDVPRAKSVISDSLQRAFGERRAHVRQALAGVLALSEKFTIISGGPGTGKSTVVQFILRAVCKYHEIPVDAVVLCAPTGRAKTRLLEAVTRDLSSDDPFSSVQARTIHSLLGISESGNPIYSKDKKLPYRLIVVDEVSMVDMRLFALLIKALSPDCRLIFIGDMNQLPPVNAGAVLGDLTSKLAENGRFASLSNRFISNASKIISELEQIDSKEELSSVETSSKSIMTDHVVFLTRNYRSDQGIIKWWDERDKGVSIDKAQCQDNDINSVIEHIRTRDLITGEEYQIGLELQLKQWINQFISDVYEPWRELRHKLINVEITDELSIAGELRKLIEKKRILCCIHEGAFGRIRTNMICDNLFRMEKKTGRSQAWHDGQPVIVNRNQGGGLELYNGDLGIVIEESSGVFGCFPVRSGVLKIPLERIVDVDQAYSISVHKSQGSEFDEVMLVVPDRSSMPVSRQLIYTAITRARKKVRIIDPLNRLFQPDGLVSDERIGLLRDIL